MLLCFCLAAPLHSKYNKLAQCRTQTVSSVTEAGHRTFKDQIETNFANTSVLRSSVIHAKQKTNYIEKEHSKRMEVLEIQKKCALLDVEVKEVKKRKLQLQIQNLTEFKSGNKAG